MFKKLKEEIINLRNEKIELEEEVKNLNKKVSFLNNECSNFIFIRKELEDLKEKLFSKQKDYCELLEKINSKYV